MDGFFFFFLCCFVSFSPFVCVSDVHFRCYCIALVSLFNDQVLWRMHNCVCVCVCATLANLLHAGVVAMRQLSVLLSAFGPLSLIDFTFHVSAVCTRCQKLRHNLYAEQAFEGFCTDLSCFDAFDDFPLAHILSLSPVSLSLVCHPRFAFQSLIRIHKLWCYGCSVHLILLHFPIESTRAHSALLFNELVSN